MCTYITQPFHDSWVSGGNSTDIDGQIQQYSSSSNDVVEVGTSELDKSEDVREGERERGECNWNIPPSFSCNVSSLSTSLLLREKA